MIFIKIASEGGHPHFLKFVFVFFPPPFGLNLINATQQPQPLKILWMIPISCRPWDWLLPSFSTAARGRKIESRLPIHVENVHSAVRRLCMFFFFLRAHSCRRKCDGLLMGDVKGGRPRSN